MKQTLQIADKPTLDKILSLLTNGGGSGGGTSPRDRHTAWLLHYESMGEYSFVYNDKDVLHELYNDYRLVMNDTNINKEAFDYIVSIGTNVGEALSNIYGIGEVDLLKTLHTLNDVKSNTTAMDAISNNEIASKLVNG